MNKLTTFIHSIPRGTNNPAYYKLWYDEVLRMSVKGLSLRDQTLEKLEKLKIRSVSRLLDYQFPDKLYPDSRKKKIYNITKDIKKALSQYGIGAGKIYQDGSSEERRNFNIPWSRIQ